MTIRSTSSRSRPAQWVHGRNCYANHGCRCDVCREGHKTYHRDAHRRRAAVKRKGATHV